MKQIFIVLCILVGVGCKNKADLTHERELEIVNATRQVVIDSMKKSVKVDYYPSTEDLKQITIRAFERGWVAGANAVTDLTNEGTASNTTIRMAQGAAFRNFEKEISAIK